MKKMKKVRRVKPWVKNAWNGFKMICFVFALTLGFMFALADDHHARQAYWYEVANVGGK